MKHRGGSVKIYLDLRDIFSECKTTSDSTKRALFENKYSTYYGLGAARLPERWRKRYFNVLFDREKKIVAGEKVYEKILLKLEHRRENGVRILPFSFVSKLIAFHDESRPLFDQRAHHFFGLGPLEFGSKEFRISGFVQNPNEIAQRYQS